MYNLLMVYAAGTWDEDEFVLELPRYLEHTALPLKERFSSLDERVIENLKEMPALFAYEDRGREAGFPARVGRIDQIHVRYGGLRITWRLDAAVPPISAEQLRVMFDDLDISQRNWEHTRSHWAIKDVDLMDVLRRHRLLALPDIPPPSVFVSYSWDSEEHRQWVRRLVGALRERGIDARSDVTHLRPGQDLGRFMEQADECDRVLVICTQNYMSRADGRVGGVGYERKLPRTADTA